MQQSYFSSVYIYINATIYLFSLYYIVYYDYLSFTEIRKTAGTFWSKWATARRQ